MPELGGSANQAGVFYQNSVAALALVDLLDFDPLPAHERTVEVRVEAPDEVDDIVVRFADDHRRFTSVKLSLRMTDAAWAPMWARLIAQLRADDFRENDEIRIVVGEHSKDSDALLGLCERGASSPDVKELMGRLTQLQRALFENVSSLSGSQEAALALLRRVSVRHLSEAEIEHEVARRKIAGGQAPGPGLFGHLRDLAAGQARRRGLFRAAPLRRRLQLERGIELPEPAEWGLASYRGMLARLCRITIPGTRVSGPSHELFVWPLALERDLALRTDFEDERPAARVSKREGDIDFRTFPSEQLDRVVLVAGPGYGKSTLLIATAGRLAQTPFVPVQIPLSALASGDTTVLEFLDGYVNREMDLKVDWRRLAEQGLLVVLFDGLDEVPAVQRPSLMKRISNFSARYPRAPWILTVRDPAVVQGLSEARTIELLPLSDDDVERFVVAMKRYAGGIEGWELVRRLQHYPDLERLVRIPLFLAMLLATADFSQPLPATRSDLIESYLKTLFSPAQHKEQVNRVDRSITLRTVAEMLAFERLERQEIGATEREVRDVVGRHVASSSEAQAVFDELTLNGILSRQSAIRLQFPFPIVQEYLAAKHLVERFPDTLERRIEDAIQRPWAQVIQFAIELHPDPEPIIQAMLRRADDGFCTGLRLLARCISNGAKVSAELRQEVGDRLVEFWIHAPTQARGRVGQVLADGFATPPSASLRAALHHSWLMHDGAGQIVSKLRQIDLTLSVLAALIKKDPSEWLMFHDLSPAFSAAGDTALLVVKEALDRSRADEEKLKSLSGLLHNFSPASVSRELALSIARDAGFPMPTRFQALKLAGAPLDDEGIDLLLQDLRGKDDSRTFYAADLVAMHPTPRTFFAALLEDGAILPTRREEMAGATARIFPDASERQGFTRMCLSRDTLTSESRTILRIMEARFGDRSLFEELVASMDRLPVRLATTVISLFGHYPERELTERAVAALKERLLTNDEVVRMAAAVATGMTYIFEMDYHFGGTLRSAPPHPGSETWAELIELWAQRVDLAPLDRLKVLASGTDLGFDWARQRLESIVFAIEDLDAPEWSDESDIGNALSNVLWAIQRRRPVFPKTFLESVLRSKLFNVCSHGIRALETMGDRWALQRLVDFQRSDVEWGLKNSAANAIESLGTKLGIVIHREDGAYRFVPPSAKADGEP